MIDVTRYRHRNTSNGLSAHKLGLFVIGVNFSPFMNLYFYKMRCKVTKKTCFYNNICEKKGHSPTFVIRKAGL